MMFLLVFLFLLNALFAQALTVTSSAFADGGNIPEQYTCDSDGSGTSNGVNPPLEIEGAPFRTESFVLTVMDVDITPLSSHWIVYNINSLESTIPANSVPIGIIDISGSNASQGINFRGDNAYAGPCPPDTPRETHRYVFTLYALDAALPLSAGATYEQVRTAMDDRIIDSEAITGYYYPQCSVGMIENGMVSPYPVCTITCNEGYRLWKGRCISGEPAGPTCGNGRAEGSEQCDDEDLNGNSCTTIPGGFRGGILHCNRDTCQFDTSGCSTEISLSSVLLGGACTASPQCVEGLSCVAGKCRNVADFLDQLRTIFNTEGLSKRQLIVRIARDLRSFLS